MALDKLVDSTQLDSDLTDVANAIRTKGGTSAPLAFPADFVSAIDAIPSGGGGIQSASGQVVLASADSNTHIVVSGLSFTPNAFLCYGKTSAKKTAGGVKIAGFRCLFSQIYANEPPSGTKTDFVTSNLPNSLFDLDATSSSQFCKVLKDGFELLPAMSTYPFEAGVTYYWKAWRFE